jgi:microcystin-dependent protein
MTWYPIALTPPQYSNTSGAPYSGAVLKAYAAGTSTVLAMATSYEGTTTASSFTLNASGYPSSGGSVIIPHIQENYDLALYPTQAAADANSGAVWTTYDNQVEDVVEAPLYDTFDGNGTTKTFTLSEDMGSDETLVMVFADRQLQDYVTNGTFATDSGWTKGSGWTIAGGVAVATGAISTDLTQNAAYNIIAGMSYTVTFTVTRSAGGVIPKIGGTSGTERTSDGTYKETIVAGSTQALTFSGNGFTGTVDTVSVKPSYGARRELLRDDEYTLLGNQLTLGEAPPTGTENIIVIAPARASGAAAASALAAATSEASALASENDAEAAQLAAEAAQGLAEDARDAAVVAQGLAEDAQDASEAAADDAAYYASIAAGGGILTITAGTGIAVDATIPTAPVVSVVGGLVPIGCGTDYWGTSAPTGWLFAYGQTLDSVANPEYAALFAVLGTTYGGTGATAFMLPDKRGRVSVGQDDMGGTSANRLTGATGSLDGDTLGATGGAETVTLSSDQMPAHTHTVGTQTDDGAAGTFLLRRGTSATATHESSSKGGGQPHNNVQPSIVCNYIIRYA